MPGLGKPASPDRPESRLMSMREAARLLGVHRGAIPTFIALNQLAADLSPVGTLAPTRESVMALKAHREAEAAKNRKVRRTAAA